jgi:hypothetical protein
MGPGVVDAGGGGGLGRLGTETPAITGGTVPSGGRLASLGRLGTETPATTGGIVPTDPPTASKKARSR